MGILVVGERVKNGVTWRAPGDFSTLDQHFSVRVVDSIFQGDNWRNSKGNCKTAIVPGLVY